MSKVWLVTGSGSGLGRNITEAVLASGARLVATARDPRRLDDVVKKYGDQVRAASLDVADENAANSAVQAAVDAFGRLDVVVNNAGYGDIAPFEQLSSERFKAVLPDYEPSVGTVIDALRSYWGRETSDPVKVAQVIVRLAESDHLPAHLLIGSDAVQYAKQADETRTAEADTWREVSISTDIDAKGALPNVRF